MSLDKAIAHGKEHRKPYRGAKAIDPTCRNHGGGRKFACPWCVENRTHKFRDKESDRMKIVTTYVADDGTEFDNEEECREYENRQKMNFESVVLFDDTFYRLTEPTSGTFEAVWYMKILDGKKATDLIGRVDDQCGVCMSGLPDKFKDGEIYAWDNDSGTWYDPGKEAQKFQDVVDAIEKAVSQLG